MEIGEAQKIVDLRDPDQSGIADCEMRITEWGLAKLKKIVELGDPAQSDFPNSAIRNSQSEIPDQSAFRIPLFPLLRSAGSGSGTVLREELPNFFSQDLIACRAQMDLIAHKQGLDRFAILPKHVGTHVDVFGLGLCLKKVVHQPIKSQNVLQKHQTRRTWFHGDERNRDRRRVGPEDGE